MSKVNKEKTIADVGSFKCLDDVSSGDIVFAIVAPSGFYDKEKPQWFAWSPLTEIFYDRQGSKPIAQTPMSDMIQYAKSRESNLNLSTIQSSYTQTVAVTAISISGLSTESFMNVFTLEKGLIQFDIQRYFVLHNKCKS